MNRKLGFFVLSIVVITTVIVLLQVFKKHGEASARSVINGIESFTVEKVGTDDHYYLFYPSDHRVSQGFTLVKEVSNTGEVIKEFELKDDDFRRAAIHQKPNDTNRLFISLFGEAVVEDWYYTYDLNEQKFQKVPLNYFKHNVGVNHIMHYGPDVIFNTIASHKTGDQDYNSHTGDFKMSISNYTQKKSYETEWGHAPDWSPILQFNGNFIYAGSGQVNDAGIAENTFVAIADPDLESAKYINFDRKAVEFAPIFTTEENAYILADTGELFVMNKDLSYETYEPYKGLPKQDLYYSAGQFLMLNEELALQGIHANGKTILGLLSLSEEPKFDILEKDYLNPTNSYKILYQDYNNKRIYIIEGDSDDKDGNLLVIDNTNFDLIHKIPIEYHYLLDMVIKN
ncbi:hypothetical protein [Sporosarcina jiandibaonis]|uniref:hypothetical protein n=1 Tax=Sporosarcina jiandibaonis TaxID=2715535 RepID=UPI00155781AF|nr:hypothetical protein [Sporosarcina jiandibaonis]